jgi:hypothetical protein
MGFSLSNFIKLSALAPWREKTPNPEKDCLAQSTQRTPSKNEIRGNAAFASLGAWREEPEYGEDITLAKACPEPC